MAKNIIDTREEVVGQNQVFDLPAAGKVGDLIDVVKSVDTPRMKVKAAEMAFMDEYVTVQIADTGSPNEEQYVQLGNNGTPQFVERGKPQKIKRKYVEVLARAKRGAVQTPEFVDASGARSTRIVKTPTLAYPFQVIMDKNPNGRAWLQRILAEA